MSQPDLRRASEDACRLADRLAALKALSEQQTALGANDAEAWLRLAGRKQEICDDLAAMALPDLFSRLRSLADPAQGDDAETTAARRRLAHDAEANIELMREIAAGEADAERRLSHGLDRLKQQAAARRRNTDLRRTYAGARAPQPRFLDSRE